MPACLQQPLLLLWVPLEIKTSCSFHTILGSAEKPGITWILWRLHIGFATSENPTELPVAIRAACSGEQLTYQFPWSHCSRPVQFFTNIHLELVGRLVPPQNLWLGASDVCPWMTCRVNWWQGVMKRRMFSVKGKRWLLGQSIRDTSLFIQPWTWHLCTRSTLPSEATLYMTLLLWSL